MSDPSNHKDAPRAANPPTSDTGPKAPWHPPKLEEVDYSATEAAGVGAVYDLTVYTGSV
ncbi:MAG TPA: hypothetical protein VF712_12870 [Thermoleophilaceae bacterium]|jgi:hypothetical protein